ncbi:unnamed protein product [Cyprideis torosa]|uniref:Uncharacterized protein n=1 Tax=Cyprideis torosa TaxID=163714 RepID=A0A7R8WIQ5_9CRUS|nr:unnamed protein product [Cyprideis torosa]CAG0901080.1 unnamed protein product [Cyprideis torosa]
MSDRPENRAYYPSPLDHPTLSDYPASSKYPTFSSDDLALLSNGPTCSNRPKRSNRSGRKYFVEPAMQGTTALIALLYRGYLVVANTGDTRGIMCCGTDGSVVPLSFDHKPQQLKERTRIEKAGGQVIFLGVWRVMGVLATSRALGDYPLKKNAKLVIPDPDVLIFDLRDFKPTFLCLASDGLWDAFTNDDAKNLGVHSESAAALKKRDAEAAKFHTMYGFDPAQEALDLLSNGRVSRDGADPKEKVGQAETGPKEKVGPPAADPKERVGQAETGPKEKVGQADSKEKVVDAEADREEKVGQGGDGGSKEGGSDAADPKEGKSDDPKEGARHEEIRKLEELPSESASENEAAL